MGMSTRRMPRHSLLEEQVDSAKLFCLNTGSHGLGQLKWVWKEQRTRSGDVASRGRQKPRSQTGGCSRCLDDL